MTLTTLALVVGLLAPPRAPSAAETSAPDSLVGPGAEVPFVAQEPMLCGGAAIAMVVRYWGSTGVYAEDFRPLVREEEGGIRTDDLVAAFAARGPVARVVRNRPDAVFAALEEGIPAILLLGGGRPRLHYVVLVQADAHDVWVHDSAWGPLRRMSRAELDARWSDSDRWALLSGPAPSSETAFDPAPRERPTEPRVPRLFDEAVAHLRGGEHAEARADARELLASGGEGVERGRRILATSFFLSGDTERALDEWNALDEPRIDLVSIEGSEASRHEVLVRRTGLEPGQLLTRRSLELARRRLSDEPSLQGSRVAFQPNVDGTVHIVGHVLERTPLPTPGRLGIEVAHGFLNQEAGIDAGPLLGAGDRWGLAVGWSRAASHARGHVDLSAHPLPGIVTVDLDWIRERHGLQTSDGTVAADDSRLHGGLGIGEWVRSDTRLSGALGLERWRSGHRVGTLSAAVHWDRDVFETQFDVQGWMGPDRPFWKGSVEAALHFDVGDHQRGRWLVGAGAVSGDAPRLMWPGAGVGQVRPALLRGYPLVEDGVIVGPGLGRQLFHTTAEYRIDHRAGPLRAGVGIFGDAALLPRQRILTDAGVEIFLAPGSSEGTVSLARGDLGWILSARVSEAW